MPSLKLKLALIVVFCASIEAIDVGRARSRHRRAITLDGLTAEEEMKMTPKEKQDFDLFKASVKIHLTCPNMKKDIYLMKFFKDNGMDVTKSKQDVLDTIEWRRKHDMDEIMKEDLSKGRKGFEAHTDLQDILGRPLLYMQTGKWGLASALATSKTNATLYERTFYQLFEESAMKSIANNEAGNKNAQYVMLVNYDGWTTEQGACVECVKLVSRLGVNWQFRYPKFGHKVVLINTAFDFHLFFDLVRLALTKETNEKLAIFGRDRAQWEPEVTKLIEKSVIDKAIALKQGA